MRKQILKVHTTKYCTLTLLLVQTAPHTRQHILWEHRVVYDWSLGNQQQGCTKAIQCRARCPSLNLVNGNDCYSTLEKEKCYFSCRAGYLLIGSSSRECLSNGQWSGTDAYCDGNEIYMYILLMHVLLHIVYTIITGIIQEFHSFSGIFFNKMLNIVVTL